MPTKQSAIEFLRDELSEHDLTDNEALYIIDRIAQQDWSLYGPTQYYSNYNLDLESELQYRGIIRRWRDTPAEYVEVTHVGYDALRRWLDKQPTDT